MNPCLIITSSLLLKLRYKLVIVYNRLDRNTLCNYGFRKDCDAFVGLKDLIPRTEVSIRSSTSTVDKFRFL